MTLRLNEAIIRSLGCPRCSSAIVPRAAEFSCASESCGLSFPVVDGVPVLIDESASLFSFSDFVSRRETTFRSTDRLLKTAFSKVMPRIGVNVAARQNYMKFAQLLTARASRPRVLVIGGGIVGKGMEEFVQNDAIELVESDVALAPRTMLVADAHNIPFQDGTFDAVIAQAVLEHVLDPVRCVEEMRRVLKADGLIFAETPFMQQVHMGPYDFTRFTLLGHRRLFRFFEEIDSGVSCGPGMALAWSWQYFLLSFTRRPLPRAFLRGFAALSAFWLKYFDYFLVARPGATDGASGVFFIGRRAERAIADRDLIRQYRGAL